MTAAPQPTPEAPLAAWEGVAVRYPYAARDAVGPVSLALHRGERVLLLGPSGSGKSTLLQTLTGIVPTTQPADLRGSVALFGEPADSRAPAGWAGDVAFLFQDAEQTLCGFTVEDEIAFAPQNAALPPDTIAALVAEAMARTGLPPDWAKRRIATLSGGEKQLVALAGVLAQGARIVVADEPSASLAPLAAERMAALLLGRKGPEGALVVDHRLGPLLPAIDRVAVLGPDGKLLADGPPRRVFAETGERMEALGIWTPLASRLQRALARAGIRRPAPLTVPELLDGLAREAADVLRPLAPLRPARAAAPPLIRLERAACAQPFGPVVLRDITLTLSPGEVLGILGPNGAGKSTLAVCLAGLVRPRGGRRHGPVGAVAFQNPEAHFTEASAREQLARRLDADAVSAALREWGLGEVAGQHPFTLSQGQKRRLALASLTAGDRWPALVLDEPTSGLDAHGAAVIADHIGRLAAAGRAVAVITHDMDFALATCDRVAILAEGGLLAEGPAARLLRDRGLLARAGLALPEAAPLIDWLEGA